MTQEKIDEILAGGGGGYWSTFIDCDFNNLNLENINFSKSLMACSFFQGCNLRGADFSFCDLRGADFYKANLEGVNFRGANLFGAKFYGAKLDGIKVCTLTQGWFPICPLEGSFIGYKELAGYIVVLKIPEDAQRISGTTFDCRADKAEVIRIENIDGTAADVTAVASYYDKNFIYRTGETVTAENYCKERFEKGGGIY